MSFLEKIKCNMYGIRTGMIILTHIIVCSVLCVACQIFSPSDSIENFYGLTIKIRQMCIISVGMLSCFCCVIISAGPLGILLIQYNLRRIGLTNQMSQPPYVIHKRSDPRFKHGIMLELENRGIPLKVWQDKQSEIEAALNIRISMIKEGHTCRRILIYAVPAQYALPDRVLWNDIYLSSKEFLLVLGQGLTGLVSVNLAIIPHILIGGSTGSGKSILFKMLLMQAVEKNASVYVADFKGGLDFGTAWEEKCHMIFSQSDLIQTLKELTSELDQRKKVLHDLECPNIIEFNKQSKTVYNRIIIGCDEIAEILDKSGKTKQEKDQIDEIVGYLSTIARQGRALGLHLILATQRPDSNILPGQIKNNIDCRICGRADTILSQIILDKGDANDLIAKDSQGRFLTNEDVLFQGFWIDHAQDFNKAGWFPHG